MSETTCMLTYKGESYKCAIELALHIIGGKWKPLIIWHLKEHSLRFGELKSSLETISQKILTEQLRQLEQDELISRKVYEEIPLKVLYTLTPKGQSVLPILEEISRWGASCSNNL